MRVEIAEVARSHRVMEAASPLVNDLSARHGLVTHISYCECALLSVRRVDGEPD
jgi:hypothetical protein